MIGGLFIYNHKGEVLISRVYRDDIGYVSRCQSSFPVRIRPLGNKLLSISVWNFGADSQSISAVCYVIGVRRKKFLKGIHQFLVIYLLLQNWRYYCAEDDRKCRDNTSSTASAELLILTGKLLNTANSF